MADKFTPAVYFRAADQVAGSGTRPVLVFAKGRTLYHAVEAGDSVIRLITLDSLRGLRPAELKGEPYPAKRAASRWLNHDWRSINARAEKILRGLVARRPKETT